MTKSGRIAKNAMSLYVRMLIATIVSLYTSRVVLRELGVEGYGTYTLVAGIVTFWLFLNGSMTVASTRFLSVAIEHNDPQEIKKTFSSVIFVHSLIALLLIVLGESVGLWFFTYKINILPQYVYAAKVVYQLSIASVAVGILQVPLTAICVAEERMGVFAVFEIVNSLLKLGIALYLIYATGNKLVIYAVLLLLGTVILFVCYMTYVTRYLGRELSIRGIDKKQVIQIFSFTSWDLYGNASVSLRMQGTAVLYNLFISAVANAALGISLQIHGVITAFANNVATAMRPQITKTYANQSYDQLEVLVLAGAKLMSGLILIPLVPIFVKMPYILQLWLGNVPDYTSGFARLTLIAVYYWSCSTLLHSIIHASGHVKKYSFVSGTIVLSEVAIMYVLFKITDFAYSPQLLRIMVLIILGRIMLYNIRSMIPQFNTGKYFTEIYLKGTLTLVSVITLTYMSSQLFNNLPDSIDLLIVLVESCLLIMVIIWNVNLSCEERALTKRLIQPLLAKLPWVHIR